MKPYNKRVQRGEIYWCDLGEAIGSEQGGCRPVIIVQNDIGNNYSTTTIVVPLTTKLKKTKLPTHHEFVNNGVAQVACAEQIRTVDKLRLGTNLGFVRKEDVDKISQCVHIAVEEIDFQPKVPHKNSGIPTQKKKNQGLKGGVNGVNKEGQESPSVMKEEECFEVETVESPQMNAPEVIPVKEPSVRYVEKNSEEQRQNQKLFFEKRAEELRLKKEQEEKKKQKTEQSVASGQSSGNQGDKAEKNKSKQGNPKLYERKLDKKRAPVVAKKQGEMGLKKEEKTSDSSKKERTSGNNAKKHKKRSKYYRGDKKNQGQKKSDVRYPEGKLSFAKSEDT